MATLEKDGLKITTSYAPEITSLRAQGFTDVVEADAAQPAKNTDSDLPAETAEEHAAPPASKTKAASAANSKPSK